MPVNFHGCLVVLNVYPRANENEHIEVKVGLKKLSTSDEPAIMYMRVYPNSFKEVEHPIVDMVYYVDGRITAIGNGIYIEPFRMIVADSAMNIFTPVISGTGRFDKSVIFTL